MLAGCIALFCLRNRRVWVLFGATVLAFIFAMGDHTPLYGWLRTAFPQIGFMRYSSKALIPTAFTWPLLGAFGIAWFLATWTSYGEVLHQSRTRSWLALAVFTVLCTIPLWGLALVAGVFSRAGI